VSKNEQKLQKYYLNENIKQEHQEYTTRTLEQEHQEILQSFTSIIQKNGCNIAARLHERNGERARESEEKFGQHRVTLKLHSKMRRGGLLLRERRRGDPLACFPSVTPKRGRLTQGGAP
jgi:hypothetical protein